MSASVHLPWQYSPFELDGRLSASVVALDGAAPASFVADDLERILRKLCSGNQFDGEARFVVRLRDGRCAAWSLSYISTEGITLHALLVAETPEPLLAALGLPPPAESRESAPRHA